MLKSLSIGSDLYDLQPLGYLGRALSQVAEQQSCHPQQLLLAHFAAQLTQVSGPISFSVP